MQTEIEATFTNVEPKAIRAKLTELGATCVQSERLMRRKNFDYPDARLYAVHGWVRVRDEGDRVTLAYKQLNDRSLHGTKEVSLVVGSFENTEVLLQAMGLEEKSYQETKRESWKLGNAEVEIDTWPWIPSYVEIEAPTEEEVREVALRLGFDWNTALHGSVENVYQENYDVTEEEVDSWDTITFTPVPDWLEAKRREKK